MSNRSSPSIGDDEELNLALEFQGLQITVRGRADRAASFVQRLAQEPASTSDTASLSSWQEIEAGSAPATAPRTTETRAAIAATFPSLPGNLRGLATSLSTTSRGWTGTERVQRAWTAGNWARAVQSGRAQSPLPTPTIDLPNKFYVVVRGPSITSPRVFKSYRELFAAVGQLEGTTTICHGFPSKAEAETYLAGAGYFGVPFP